MKFHGWRGSRKKDQWQQDHIQEVML
jgi:hypothetical protein